MDARGAIEASMGLTDTVVDKYLADLTDADLGAVVAQRARAEPGHQLVIVAPAGLEEPAAHRLEDRGQRIERLLQRREAAKRSVEVEIGRAHV